MSSRTVLAFAGSIVLVAAGVVVAVLFARHIWIELVAFVLIMGGIAYPRIRFVRWLASKGDRAESLDEDD